MQSRSKLILVGGVLLTGIAGALTFRHQHPTAATKPAAGPERRVQEAAPDGESHLLGHIEPLAGQADGGNRADAAASPVPVNALQPPAPQASDDAHPFAARVAVGAASTAPPVAADSRAAEMPADSPWTASTRDQPRDLLTGGGTAPQRGASNAFQSPASSSAGRIPYKTHRVRDGDTLSSLAQHYLGDGSRWQEIFELNRDRLRDADILPIGSKLKIPEATAAPPVAATDVAPRGPQTTFASDRSNIFVETPADSTPTRAAPLVPVAPGSYRAASERPQTATYRVQPRDTLVSIARQLYGDESRFQAIYEANRQRIPDPNNLPAGVELTIP